MVTESVVVKVLMSMENERERGQWYINHMIGPVEEMVARGSKDICGHCGQTGHGSGSIGSDTGGGNAQWFRTAKNRDVNTGPLVCSFPCSIAPLTHLLAPHCHASLAGSAALIRSLTHSKLVGK